MICYILHSNIVYNTILIHWLWRISLLTIGQILFQRVCPLKRFSVYKQFKIMLRN